jgi:hypothetical protein
MCIFSLHLSIVQQLEGKKGALRKNDSIECCDIRAGFQTMRGGTNDLNLYDIAFDRERIVAEQRRDLLAGVVEKRDLPGPIPRKLCQQEWARCLSPLSASRGCIHAYCSLAQNLCLCPYCIERIVFSTAHNSGISAANECARTRTTEESSRTPFY